MRQPSAPRLSRTCTLRAPQVRQHIYLHKHIYTYTGIDVYTYTYICIDMYVYMYVDVIYIYIYIYLYIHTYVWGGEAPAERAQVVAHLHAARRTTSSAFRAFVFRVSSAWESRYSLPGVWNVWSGLLSLRELQFRQLLVGDESSWGVPRQQKKLKRHLPRVIYITKYMGIRRETSSFPKS